MNMEEKSIPGRGNNKYKVFKTGTSLECITAEEWDEEREEMK